MRETLNRLVQRVRSELIIVSASSLLLLCPVVPAIAASSAARSLADLSLEELRDVVVSSVARYDQPLLDAPASVYVITGDAIRRIGATTLPEALRLAPNLQVAAIDARQYAISARGFNGNIANKLLVMVDGRTIYSPLFSGVFWDAQDFVPADIDRIEVISGPAGATWGTNAVHGVINVVTLPASRTQGASVSTTLGTQESTVVGRYGSMLSDDLSVRAHAKTFRRDASRPQGGGEAGDASRGTSAGVRADWKRGDDAVMLNAGVYDGHTDDRPLIGPVDLRGANLTGRWSHRLGEAANFDVQAYVDSTERSDKYLLQEEAEIFDVEAKYRHVIGDHRWLAGAGYRRAQDRSEPGLLFAFFPPERQLDWYSVFAQDEIAVSDRLALTLGLRMEHNSYSGWEALPSARIGYRLQRQALAWAAVSRAVRSPSRFDREIFVPTQPPFAIAGGPNFTSEVANVVELGYRTQLGADASVSVTGFLYDYDRLRSGETVGSSFQFENKIQGQLRGVEAWGNWSPLPQWRLDAGVLLLDKNLRVTADSNDAAGAINLGNDARSQWSLRSLHSFGERLDISFGVRHVGRLPAPEIPSYTAADVTANWRVIPQWQISLGVRDLFDERHAEYQGFQGTSEIPRSAFVSLTYQPRR